MLIMDLQKSLSLKKEAVSVAYTLQRSLSSAKPFLPRPHSKNLLVFPKSELATLITTEFPATKISTHGGKVCLEGGVGGTIYCQNPSTSQESPPNHWEFLNRKLATLSSSPRCSCFRAVCVKLNRVKHFALMKN